MPRAADPDREQRILDAAADLIAHFGYDKTTVDDIARRAGVSKGAIYLHFKSKDDLFEGLLTSNTFISVFSNPIISLSPMFISNRVLIRLGSLIRLSSFTIFDILVILSEGIKVIFILSDILSAILHVRTLLNQLQT